MKNRWNLMPLLLLTIAWMGCKSEYQKMVDRELQQNKKVDSLFFNYRLGDSKEAYHEKSWNLNHNKVVVQGRSYHYMKYVYQDPKTPEKQNDFIMEYTGKFNKSRKLNQMEVIFSHPLWVPWNAAYHAEVLLPRVLDSLVLWYGGNPFVQYQLENDSIPSIYVKVDGDRRFRAYTENTQDVIVKIDDLNENN
jgi:hypothetical protein